jgi:hypothetical protein
MSDEHTLALQDITADRNCRSQQYRKHYRQVAHWLRGVAAKCRLPDPQTELLDIAGRYDRRANQLDKL